MEKMAFYKGKKVLVTGHTGFKGSWMCKMLLMLGADVTGYALRPPTQPNLFELCHLQEKIRSIDGDIRDITHLLKVFREVQPEIVIHMAAQPIVRESYKNPVYTYEVNVMGTVNILECVRLNDSVRSLLNVTTDKVYKNKEWYWGYRENEELNGYDPYSNSKSCSELITDSYKNSFFQDGRTAISTVRAGNVVGGGDFAEDRIIPDCIRAVEQKRNIIVRNPYSVRPFQHVLESVAVYLLLAQAQYEDTTLSSCYNLGPDEKDCLETGDLVTLFCREWKQVSGQNVEWINQYDGGPHEADLLKLDCSKLKTVFGWKPEWDMNKAIQKTAEWAYCYLSNGNVEKCIDNQIESFLFSD